MPDGLNESVGMDTTAFKSGAAELIRQVKNIENSFKASAAVMGTWSTSSDGLKSRISTLKEEIENQKGALDKLHSAYNTAVSGGEAQQKQADILAQQMYKLEGQITRNEKALGNYQSKLESIESPAAGLQEKLNALGQQVQLSASKFQITASAMGDWSSKSEGLRAKLESLREIESAQKQQVSELESVYVQVAQKQGANSTAANDLAIKLNEARAAFEKTGSDIRSFSRDLADAEAKEKEQSSPLGKLKNSFQELGEKAEENGHKVSNIFSGLKSSIAGFATGLVASLSFKEVAEETDSVEKTAAQMTAVLKSTGSVAGMTASQLGELAESQAKVTTYSEDTTKQAENMLLTFTNIKSNVFPQTIKAAEDMATAMGTSATDAAKTLGKALNDPANGLSKLTKQGVTFTADQQKQIKAMQASGNVAGAQALMLQELEREFGGSAKAAGSTLTGQTQIMENNLKEAGVRIAEALMPIVQTVLPMIIQGAQNLAKEITAHKAQIQNAVQNITTVIKDVFGWIETHGPAVKVAVIGIGSAFAGLKIATVIGGIVLQIGKAKKAIQDVKGAATGAKVFSQMFGFSPQILLIIALIALLAVGIYELVTHWKQVTAAAKAFGSGCMTVLNTVKGAITSALVGALNGVKSAWNGIAGFFSGIWNGIKVGVTTAGNGIKIAFVTVWQVIRTAVMAIVTPFVQGIMSLWNGMKTGIQTIMNGLKNILGGIWTVIKNVVMAPVLLLIDLVTGNFTKLKSDAISIFNNLKNAFVQIWMGIKQVFTGAVQAIAGFLTVEWNGIVSGATITFNALAVFFSILWTGIKNTAVTVWNALVGFFTGLPGTIGGIMNAIGSWVRNVWDSLVGFIGSIPGRFAAGLSSLGGTVRGAFDDAINFIRNLPSEALGWGRDIIDGIVGGIRSAADHVRTAVGNVAQDIRSFLHFSKPDTGPLADFDTYMPDMMTALANGITGNVGKLRNAAAQAAGVLASGLQVAAVAPASSNSYSSSVTNNDSQPRFYLTINANGMNPSNQQDAEKAAAVWGNVIVKQAQRKGLVIPI